MTFSKVINYNYVGACRYTGYQNKAIKLKLECGHDYASRKASDFEGHGKCIPKKVRCRDCERDERDKQEKIS